MWEPLAYLGDSLRVLRIITQNVREMVSFGYLPNLTELYLSNNKIERIRFLEDVPNLQRLWLDYNQISVIENLEHLADLRELFLQGNNISSLAYVSRLKSLNSLQVSGNPISNYQEIENLVHLQALFDLSFADYEHDACPVAEIEGYRSFVIFHLKQVKVLDGYPISERNRSEVEDAYLKSVLEFNHRVDALKAENRSALQNIEHKKKVNEQKCAQSKEQLLNSLLSLGKAIDDGRNRVLVEYDVQSKRKSLAEKALSETMRSLKDSYEKEVNRLVEKEKLKMEAEDRLYQRLVKKLELEGSLQQQLTVLATATEGDVIVAHLHDRHPEHRLARKLFESWDEELAVPEVNDLGEAVVQQCRISVSQVYKVSSSPLLKGFHDFPQASTASTRYFAIAPVEVLLDILQGGFSPNTPTILFASAKDAHRSYLASQSLSSSLDVGTHALLICRANLGKTTSVTVREPWRSGSEVPASSPNAHSVLCSRDIPLT